METLSQAIARLERAGFEQTFRARPDGRLEVEGDGPVAPESLTVEEAVRFEGESDPGDEAVLFALRSRDGRIRGTFTSAFGTHVDPDCAAVIQRLGQADPRDETPA